MRQGAYMISINEVVHSIDEVLQDLARCTDEGVEEVLRDDLYCYQAMLGHELYNAN